MNSFKKIFTAKNIRVMVTEMTERDPSAWHTPADIAIYGLRKHYGMTRSVSKADHAKATSFVSIAVASCARSSTGNIVRSNTKMPPKENYYKGIKIAAGYRDSTKASVIKNDEPLVKEIANEEDESKAIEDGISRQIQSIKNKPESKRSSVEQAMIDAFNKTHPEEVITHQPVKSHEADLTSVLTFIAKADLEVVSNISYECQLRMEKLIADANEMSRKYKEVCDAFEKLSKEAFSNA